MSMHMYAKGFGLPAANVLVETGHHVVGCLLAGTGD